MRSGDRDAAHAGRLGGCDAGFGVLEDGDLLGAQPVTEELERQQVAGRVRLAAGDVLGRDHDADDLCETGGSERRDDLVAMRAGDDGHRDAPGGLEHGRARFGRDRRPVRHRGAIAGHALGHHRLHVRVVLAEPETDDLRVGQAGQPFVVVLLRERASALGEKVAQDREEQGLVVGERPVEVEHEGACGHGVRQSRIARWNRSA